MKTKRLVSSILVAVLLIACLSTAASASSIGVVHTFISRYSNVNLRSGGGTSYPVIGSVNNGDLVLIRSQSRYWSRCTVRSGVSKGMTGYIYNKYITNLRDIEDISEWGALAHVRSSTLQLRKGPSTSYGVKETLNYGDMLIILDRFSSNWYEVQVVNSLRTGFVYRSYIANGIIGYTTASVNLRARGSSSARILDVIPSGESITVLYVGKYWSKVRYDGRTGYIYNGYLKLY